MATVDVNVTRGGGRVSKGSAVPTPTASCSLIVPPVTSLGALRSQLPPACPGWWGRAVVSLFSGGSNRAAGMQ